MPIYEYRCTSCNTLNEFFLKVSDPHPQTCPACGASGSLQKQISQTSFALKGEGWYVTDYKQSGGAAKATAPESEANAAGAAEVPSKDGAAAAPSVSADKATAPAANDLSGGKSAVASGASGTKSSSPD